MSIKHKETEMLSYLLDNAAILSRIVILKVTRLGNFLVKNANDQLHRQLNQLHKANSMLEKIVDEITDQRRLIQTLVPLEIESSIDRLQMQTFVSSWREVEQVKKKIVEGTYQTIAQVFFSLQLSFQELTTSTNDQRLIAKINELSSFMQDSMKSVRSISFELYPLMLEDLGLIPAVKSYVTHLMEGGLLTEVYEVNGHLRRHKLETELKVFRMYQELEFLLFHYSAAHIKSITFNENDSFIQFYVTGQGDVDCVTHLPELQQWCKKMKALRGSTTITGNSKEFNIHVKIY